MGRAMGGWEAVAALDGASGAALCMGGSGQGWRFGCT